MSKLILLKNQRPLFVAMLQKKKISRVKVVLEALTVNCAAIMAEMVENYVKFVLNLLLISIQMSVKFLFRKCPTYDL